MTTTEKNAKFDLMKRVLEDLIYTVEHEECQGRLYNDDEGFVCAEIPPLDAGTAYIHACEALGRTPKLLPVQKGEG